MNVFGLVLTRVWGQSMEDVFRRRIAEPIQMNPEAWDWGDYATIDGLVVNSGSGNGGKHIQISAREMARLGHLFLNQGRWDGQQLISRKWVRTATSLHVPATVPWAHPASGIDGRGVYGCNWWVNGVQPDGERIWRMPRPTPLRPADTIITSCSCCRRGGWSSCVWAWTRRTSRSRTRSGPASSVKSAKPSSRFRPRVPGRSGEPSRTHCGLPGSWLTWAGR